MQDDNWRVGSSIGEFTTHKHHIMPKHAGGAASGETVDLLVIDHAIAHRVRYMMHGNKADRWSAVRLYNSIGNRFDQTGENNPMTDSRVRKNYYEAMKKLDRSGEKNPMWGKNHKKSTKKIMSEKSIGVGNSQYGKWWIRTLDCTQEKKIEKDSRIPKGWERGRKTRAA